MKSCEGVKSPDLGRAVSSSLWVVLSIDVETSLEVGSIVWLSAKFSEVGNKPETGWLRGEGSILKKFKTKKIECKTRLFGSPR